MNKQAFIDALKSALAGLSPDVVSRTVLDYEQRFENGAAAGRSEEDLAASFGNPERIAANLKADIHSVAFQQRKSPANLWRLFISLIGLGMFNLFLVVPAIVFSALLFASYAASFGFFVGGVAVTASGLSGVHSLDIDRSGDRVVLHSPSGAARAKHGAASASASASASAAASSPAQAKLGVEVIDGDDDEAFEDVHMNFGEFGDMSRPAQSLLGIAIILSGILLFLLNLIITKYSFIGLKRYAMMNYSLLKNA